MILTTFYTFAGCMGGDEESPSPTQTTQTGTNTTVSAPPAEKKQTFTLTDVGASAFDIVPANYPAKANDRLNFTAMGPSTNQVSHNFKIPDFEVSLTGIAPGQSQNVTFVADKKGTFPYFCDVGNHRQLGMEGTLTVS